MITLLLLGSLASATPSPNLPVEAVPEVVATPETTAQSGILVIEANMPVEVIIDHVKLTQMWVPGTVQFEILAGRRALSLYVAGQPTNLPVDILADREVRVLVGRTGISVSSPEVAPVDATTAELELRVVGGGAVQVRL